MASQNQDIRTRFEELSAGAQFDILVPTSPDFDPTTLFHDGLPGRLSSAPSRRNLYYDETTQLNLIIRTSLGERAARSLLGSLEIVLAANATDAVPQGQGNAASASGKHDLTSKTISGLEISNVLFAGEQTNIIWKPILHIPRPRVRLQRPAVYFTASLNLTSSALSASRNTQSDLLKSFEPLPGNVLDPLRFDPALGDSDIYLPEDRITKVLPTSTTARDEIKPVRAATKRAFPIVPALYTRIRYSTLPDAVIASLHVETSQLVSGSVSINNVLLETKEADVRNVTSSTNSTGLLAGDEVVSLYKLRPKGHTASASSPVSVKIQATVHIEHGSSVDLEISWQTQVDLSKVGTKPTYKWSRPLSGGPLQPPSRPSFQGGARPAPDGTGSHPLGDQGMTFNFTSHVAVNAGDRFSIDVHCVNRSGRARRFAIVALHAKRQHMSRHQRGSSLGNADLVASIFNAPLLERTKPSDALDLNPDVRFGPLPSRTIFETQLKFQAVATGPLDLGIIRIVDLDTRQTVDVRDLPDIIALELAGERDSSPR